MNVWLEVPKREKCDSVTFKSLSFCTVTANDDDRRVIVS